MTAPLQSPGAALTGAGAALGSTSEPDLVAGDLVLVGCAFREVQGFDRFGRVVLGPPVNGGRSVGGLW